MPGERYDRYDRKGGRPAWHQGRHEEKNEAGGRPPYRRHPGRRQEELRVSHQDDRRSRARGRRSSTRTSSYTYSYDTSYDSRSRTVSSASSLSSSNNVDARFEGLVRKQRGEPVATGDVRDHKSSPAKRQRSRDRRTSTSHSRHHERRQTRRLGPYTSASEGGRAYSLPPSPTGPAAASQRSRGGVTSLLPLATVGILGDIPGPGYAPADGEAPATPAPAETPAPRPTLAEANGTELPAAQRRGERAADRPSTSSLGQRRGPAPSLPAPPAPSAAAVGAPPFTSNNPLTFADRADYLTWLRGDRETVRAGTPVEQTPRAGELDGAAPLHHRKRLATPRQLPARHPLKLTERWEDVSADRPFLVLTDEAVLDRWLEEQDSGAPLDCAQPASANSDVGEASAGAKNDLARTTSDAVSERLFSNPAHAPERDGSAQDSPARGETARQERARCFRAHFDKGRVHPKPPWRTCVSMDDNHEHPYYVDWLDSIDEGSRHALALAAHQSADGKEEEGKGLERERGATGATTAAEDTGTAESPSLSSLEGIVAFYKAAVQAKLKERASHSQA